MKIKTKLLIPLIAASLLTVRAADIREGLVSYWPLDSIAADLSSTPDVVSGNHLWLGNFWDTSPLVNGQRGKALQFDGDNNYLYAYHVAPEGADVGLPISRARSYSILFWVKGKGTGQVDRRIFSEGSSTSNDPLFNIGTHNGGANDAVDIFIRNSGARVNHAHSPTAGLDDQWRHLAFTYENGQAQLYIDGTLDWTGSFTPGPTPYDTTSIGAIMRASPSHYFAGIIDEVALWERALSAAEIQTIMTAGIQTPVPSFAPTILVQPQGSTALVEGDAYTLSAHAIGTRPLTFEWRKNNTPIPNATGLTLALTDLKPGDSGDYTIAVRNNVGTTTSPVAALLVNPPPPPNLTNGMVAYWPLDEVQGTKTPDVASGYDMELINLTAADLVTGKWGKAFRFANSGQTMLERLNLPTDELPIYKHPNFTVSLWVNGPPYQQDLRVFSEASTTVNTPLFNIGTHQTAASGVVDIYVRDDASQQGGHRYSVREAFDDTWHHIVYVQRELDGVPQAVLYIDGVKDDVELDPRRPLTANSTSIGGIRRATAGFWFNGLIDDVALWKRALSQEEISRLFTEGTPRPDQIVAQPLAIRSFKSNLPAVGKGDPVTLQWDVSRDATSISIDQGVGNVLHSTVVGLGKITLPLDQTKTFTLTVSRGNESLSATVKVAAIDGIGNNWALLDNFDQYNLGAFPSMWWGDLGGNSAVAEVNGNRMLNLRGTGRIAVLPLGDLTVREGQQRTLFTRIYVQGAPAEDVRSMIGLTDRGLRFVGDATDEGGVGPAAFPSNENWSELMIGARYGVLGARDFSPPLLETGQLYNLWLDVQNNSVAAGDMFTIYLQAQGQAARTQLFVDYLSDRDPMGNPAAAGGGPTLPDLDKVFVGNNAVNAVFFDDIYISKSGYNSTIPRVVGFTGAPSEPEPGDDLIAYEPFDYPAGDLAGREGGSGWAAPWQGNNTPAGGALVQASSLTYTDSKGNPLATSGGKGFLTGLSGTAQPFREIPAVRGTTGTTSWFSLLGVRVGPTTNNTVEPGNIYPRAANVSLFNMTLASSQEQLAVGSGTGAPDNNWALLPDGSVANRQASTVPFSEPAFVVVRINHNEGNDDAYLWLNPDLDAEPSIANANAQSIGAFDYSFNRVRPFAGNPQAANSRPHAEMLVDELRVGRTFAAVAPIGGGSPPSVTISRVANRVELRWSEGTLESAPAITGPWSAVSGATAPAYDVAPQATQMFFRLRR
jgi:hypothetical protein